MMGSRTTKDLARELGFLRKRSSHTQQRKERSARTRQIFSHLVVLDFESTCWQDAKYRTQEIIEFPAVLLNTATGNIVSEFQYYVQPQENPMLSDFCKELTGITQDQVDEGIPLAIVLSKFCHWLKKNSQEHQFVYNLPSDDGTARCTFVTWSDWDLGVCLQYEARRKQLRKPQELNSWLDLRATYKKFYERKPKGLNGALQDLGLDFEGREHSGLHDARNTARLAYRMMRDGCVLNITKTIQGPETRRESLIGNNKITPISTTAVGYGSEAAAASTSREPTTGSGPGFKTAAGAVKAVHTIQHPPSTNTGGSSTGKLDDDVSVNGIPVQTEASHSRAGASGSRLNDPVVITPLLEYAGLGVLSRNNKNVLSCIQQVSVHPKRTRSISKNAVIPNISSSPPSKKGKIKPQTKFTVHQDENTNKTDIKRIGSGAMNLRDVTNTCGSSEGNSKTSKYPNNGCFKTPYFPSVAVNGPGILPSKSSSFSTVGTSFKTPVGPTNVKHGHSKSSMKATPPMCTCGRRAKRKFVQSPGPNQGRAFFCCGVVRSQKTSTKGCNFFKWEPSESKELGTSPVLRGVPAVKTFKSYTSGNMIVPTKDTKFVPFSHLPQPDFSTPQEIRTFSTLQNILNTKKTLGVRSTGISVFRPLIQ